MTREEMYPKAIQKGLDPRRLPHHPSADPDLQPPKQRKKDIKIEMADVTYMDTNNFYVGVLLISGNFYLLGSNRLDTKMVLTNKNAYRMKMTNNHLILLCQRGIVEIFDIDSSTFDPMKSRKLQVDGRQNIFVDKHRELLAITDGSIISLYDLNSLALYHKIEFPEKMVQAYGNVNNLTFYNDKLAFVSHHQDNGQSLVCIYSITYGVFYQQIRLDQSACKQFSFLNDELLEIIREDVSAPVPTLLLEVYSIKTGSISIGHPDPLVLKCPYLKEYANFDLACPFCHRVDDLVVVYFNQFVFFFDLNRTISTFVQGKRINVTAIERDLSALYIDENRLMVGTRQGG
eukprot:CAMPEP_0117422390 /NCGR_PEP_ID=MMETSP0758-20121206/3240_1 /TAXON_ID=63605 /ORGANISM="Percolomonas cosmopolitus, Strain AE-1 (ATCC 50343)" /LENGTH=344 /DNA_ID=CAMNT_0005204983 /DNA_START=327 /DNA_END=1358 /DNA_ORIENTATION=-